MMKTAGPVLHFIAIFLSVLAQSKGADIHAIHPVTGSHAGGTLVTIEGAGFAYEGMEGVYLINQTNRHRSSIVSPPPGRMNI
jgi:hypothetical protein